MPKIVNVNFGAFDSCNYTLDEKTIELLKRVLDKLELMSVKNDSR